MIYITGFYACKKKNLTEETNSSKLGNYSVKKETNILNLSEEFKKTNAVEYLEKIDDLDIDNLKFSTLNETDSITFYTFKYKSSEKILVLYHFEKSDRFVPLNIEHKINLSDKNREEIILSDYNNTPFLSENYDKKVFMGFSDTISAGASKSRISSKGKIMFVEAPGGGESCYECINRVYQASVKKCSENVLCDLECSLNISCKILFAISALAVCTSPMSRPCSPIHRTYE